MSDPDKAVGYRRNGKKQACETCRKGKLRCDHGTPYCGRCIRLKTTDRCIYHPAPMTREKVASNGTPGFRTSRESYGHQKSSVIQNNSFSSPINTTYHSIGVQTVAPGNQSLTFSVDKQQSLGDSSYPRKSQANWKKAVYPRSSRYYGPTSFQAMFSESQANLNEELLYLGDETRKHPGTWVFGQPLLGRQRPNTPVVRTTHTIKALWNIPNQDTCFKLFEGFKSMHDSTLDPTMIFHCISSLWQNFEDELTMRTDETLAAISDVLFDNEEAPLPPSPDNGMEWLKTFTGPNIRFEMLGILFSFFGLAYLFLQDLDPLLAVPENDGRDRKQSAWRMKECADVCLNMCDSAETVNFLVTALIFNVKVLESGCTGDETYKIRRLNGDMVTSAISSGLHRLPTSATSKLTAASEYKRRLFSAIYCSDKTHSSLNGTPPLLPRRYCDIEPCLDLDPKAPYLSEGQLLQAIDDLDEAGWNTAGNMFDTTLLRAKVHLSVIREEILELSLGVGNLVTSDIIEELHHRSQKLFGGFPTQLHFYSFDKTPKGTTGAVLYEQAYIMLQSLQNNFLLYRVAIARGLANEQGLLDNALEMLDISLMFWMKRDELMLFSSGFDWIITYYGIPSAGVICVELLKQSTGHTLVQFSRSDAIQKLTLFIGFLEWIRPTHGNFNLTARLKQVIKRVLDHVLENRQLEEPTELEFEQAPFDPMLPPYNELQDLDWLNTIDWTQGSWLEFS